MRDKIISYIKKICVVNSRAAKQSFPAPVRFYIEYSRCINPFVGFSLEKPLHLLSIADTTVS